MFPGRSSGMSGRFRATRNRTFQCLPDVSLKKKPFLFAVVCPSGRCQTTPSLAIVGSVLTALLDSSPSGDVNPVSGVLLVLAIILVSSKVGGDLAMRLGQPAVLGELASGILLGNLGLVGFHALDSIRRDPYIILLAEIGVVLLLFEVGLASTVREMAKVGISATIVAVLGVVAPLFLGWGVGAVLLPHGSVYAHVFIGSALTATSVGITARVLRDLKRSDSAEGRIILGAAVIDDVLGLVVLATVGGIIGAANNGGTVSVLDIGLIVGKAAGFLVTAVLLGGFLSPRIFKAAFRLRGSGVLIVSGLVICFLFSYAASRAGPGSHRGRVRGGAGARAGALPEPGRPRRRFPARGSLGAGHVFPGSGVFRTHGSARGSGRVRQSARPGPGAGSHGRGHHRQTGLRARRGTRHRPAQHRAGNDPPRRGGADLREHGTRHQGRREAHPRPRHVFGHRDHGDPDDAGHAAGSALEPLPTCTRRKSAAFPAPGMIQPLGSPRETAYIERPPPATAAGNPARGQNESKERGRNRQGEARSQGSAGVRRRLEARRIEHERLGATSCT